MVEKGETCGASVDPRGKHSYFMHYILLTFSVGHGIAEVKSDVPDAFDDPRDSNKESNMKNEKNKGMGEIGKHPRELESQTLKD